MHNYILLNPSCSELVTFLGITEIEEIRLVLKDICSRFGYKVKLIPSDYDPYNNPGIEIDPDKLDLNKDTATFVFNDLLIDDSNYNLTIAYNNNLITMRFYAEHLDDGIKLRTLVSFLSQKPATERSIISLVLIDDQDNRVMIKYRLCEAYDDTHGLSLYASQDSSINEYTILGNIFLSNPGKYKYYAFDGGNTELFKKWLDIKISHSPEELEYWMKEQQKDLVEIQNFSFKSDKIEPV